MVIELRDELRQGKPFESGQQEAQLNVLRTAALLLDAFDRLLVPYGITGTQYNVLRILRGSEPDGLCRNELRDRMLSRMPDVTRLLDRMEESGLVERTRSTEDRRLVTTHITEKGGRLLDELGPLVAEEHRRRFAHLSEGQLRHLIELLTLVRNAG